MSTTAVTDKQKEITHATMTTKHQRMLGSSHNFPSITAEAQLPNMRHLSKA